MTLAAICTKCGVMGAGCICQTAGQDWPPELLCDPIPRKDIELPPSIPVPTSRKHAELMLLVAQRYLDDNPTP